MHPKNVPCLTAAGIDCCVLANNHVLDWGYQGLTETLQILHDADLKTAGAGQNALQAKAPAVMEMKLNGRVIVFHLVQNQAVSRGKRWLLPSGSGSICCQIYPATPLGK